MRRETAILSGCMCVLITISILTCIEMFRVENISEKAGFIDTLQLSLEAYDISNEKKILLNEMPSIMSVELLQNISLMPPFPIDVVYTFGGETNVNGQRLRYNGDLRYSMRSIYKYIPWVNAIYIIISEHTSYPSWIIEEKTKKPYCSIPLYIIKHSDIVFKIENSMNNHDSQSIESRVHHISGLSNHFIYLNDDFFIFQYTSYLFFFTNDGIPRYPSCFLWDYYNDLKTNPILTRPIYPKLNQQRLNIDYTVPYRMKKLFSEHMTRAYTRISWLELEIFYNEWFKFVETHKKRFCSSSQSRSGCFEEDMYLIMTTYRLLHLNMQKNKTLEQEIKNISHPLYQLLNKKAFDIDIFEHKYKGTKKIHKWLTGHDGFNVGDLDKFIKDLIQYKPHTFCMNDVLSNDVKSNLYTAELRCIHRFYQKYLNESTPFERDNFIEPVLRDILNDDLDKIKYNKFGWELSKINDSKYINLMFSHIPINDGERIEKFGLKHNILWGKNYENSEFICKKDLFSASKNKICCHSELFPAAYTYNQWNLDINDVFCVIRHPFKRILEQYKHRLNKDSYWAEEKSLMREIHEEKDKNLNNLNNYWCNIETMNKWIIASLKMYSSHRSIRDCHFLPQIEYIFDKTKKKKLCKNVLRMDDQKKETKLNFYQQFDDLMTKYNINTTDSLKNYHSKKNQKCNHIAKVNNIYNDTKQFIQQIYKEDFEYFDFEIAI